MPSTQTMPIRRFVAALMMVSAYASGIGECLGSAAAKEQTVSFRNDIMAVLSKAGCNSGPCHGNQNGKAGFKLSLRGEDAEFDLAALTRDMFARRVDPANPEQSLVLLKATTQLAHEGGLRFRKESPEYGMFRRWIADGAPDDTATALKQAKVLMGRGIQLLKEHRYNEALATFQEGFRAYPDPAFILNEASTLSDAGRHSEAVLAYERYLSDPDAPRADEARAAMERAKAAMGGREATITGVVESRNQFEKGAAAFQAGRRR